MMQASQLMCKSDERTAAQQFAEWESRIANNQKTAACLDGLDAKQRMQLAALSIEIVSAFEDRAATDRSTEWVRHLLKEVNPRLRMLNRKLQKIRKAAEELQAYAVDAGEENVRETSRHKARFQLGQAYLETAAAVIGTLDKHNVHTAKAHRDASSGFLTPSEDVEVFGMVRLYWFFRHGCNLSGHKSEVRVARLRNVFWAEYGIEAVKYRSKYDGIASQGCEAVRLAVKRYKPDKVEGYKPAVISA